MVCRISSVTQAGLGGVAPLGVVFWSGPLCVWWGFPLRFSGRAPGQCEIRCNEWCRGVVPGGDAVPDVSKLFGEHYCCELAILTFAGKDASEELNVIYPPDVVGKRAAADVEVDTVAAVREAVQQRGVDAPRGWAQVAAAGCCLAPPPTWRARPAVL